MKMKKCKLCEHHAYNDHDEEICRKHLLYVGDNVENDIFCNDFTVNAGILPGIIVIIVFICLLFLINALI